MRGIRLFALAALLAGLALLAFAALEGNVRVGFFLIVPYVIGEGVAAFFGMALLFAAATMYLLRRVGAPRGEDDPGWRSAPEDPMAKEPQGTRSGGGVVLVGPIPIVWGGGKVLPWMVAAGAALLVLALVVSWALR